MNVACINYILPVRLERSKKKEIILKEKQESLYFDKIKERSLGSFFSFSSIFVMIIIY